MRRRLVQIVVFLLLGAIVNIALASGCHSHTARNGVSTQTAKQQVISRPKVAATQPSPSKVDPSTIVVQIAGMQPMQFVLIKSGKFIMGENQHFAREGTLKQMLHAGKVPSDEGPEHEVTITKPFYLAQTEITVENYCVFLNDVDGPERYIKLTKWTRILKDEEDRYVPRPGCERYPVNTVPWAGAVAFCKWLSGKSGRAVRLPTEAEWEFAARGSEGRDFPWAVPMKTKDYELYFTPVSRDDEPWSGSPVGERPMHKTPEGALDMGFGAGEWVSDWYGRVYPKEAQIDPQGPATGTDRIIRGRACGATKREPISVRNEDKVGFIGFRPVLEISNAGDP